MGWSIERNLITLFSGNLIDPGLLKRNGRQIWNLHEIWSISCLNIFMKSGGGDLKFDGRRPPPLLFSIFCERGGSHHQNKDDVHPIFSSKFVKVGGGTFKIGRTSITLNFKKWVCFLHKKKERLPLNFMMVALPRRQINLILVKRSWQSSLNWWWRPPSFWFSITKVESDPSLLFMKNPTQYLNSLRNLDNFFEKWRSDLKSDGRRPPSLLFSIFCNRGWSCHQNKDDLPPFSVSDL